MSTIFEITNRSINTSPTIKDIVVQGDMNSKTIIFNMSNRFFDGVDLSSKSIQIAFQNSIGESDYDTAYLDELFIDSFTFKWTLSERVAVQAGTVFIGVEFSEIDSISGKKYIWKTKPSSFNVEQSFTVLGNITPLNYTAQQLFYGNNNNNTVTSINDTNEAILIDNRRILMPILEDIVVSGDNRSQIISFTLPKYFENIDLSTKVISIKFLNARLEGDRTSAVNVSTTDTTITFGWLIDSKVTIKDGVVNFAIEFFGYENGKFYCWSTTPAQLMVSKGLHVDGMIAEPEPSWIQNFLYEKEQYINYLNLIKSNLMELYLQSDIKGTTQKITWDAEEQPIKIQHILPNKTVLREDIFTYSANLITETRTMNTGEKITYKYHLDTFETEII